MQQRVQLLKTCGLSPARINYSRSVSAKLSSFRFGSKRQQNPRLYGRKGRRKIVTNFEILGWKRGRSDGGNNSAWFQVRLQTERREKSQSKCLRAGWWPNLVSHVVRCPHRAEYFQHNCVHRCRFKQTRQFNWQYFVLAQRGERAKPNCPSSALKITSLTSPVIATEGKWEVGRPRRQNKSATFTCAHHHYRYQVWRLRKLVWVREKEVCVSCSPLYSSHEWCRPCIRKCQGKAAFAAI